MRKHAAHDSIATFYEGIFEGGDAFWLGLQHTKQRSHDFINDTFSILANMAAIILFLFLFVVRGEIEQEQLLRGVPSSG